MNCCLSLFQQKLIIKTSHVKTEGFEVKRAYEVNCCLSLFLQKVIKKQHLMLRLRDLNVKGHVR